MTSDVKEVLISEQQIAQKVRELGERISADYAGKDLMVVGILKGAIIFLSDLVRSISVPLKLDFMAVSSYGSGTTSSGAVRILKDLETSIEGKHVLIVEDIVDTGLTLRYLLENLRSRGPASVKTCTFLDKPTRRTIEVHPDYNGFEIPDYFVVGYGLDFNEHYRHLPYIAVLKPDASQK
ncbi:hypoxanthine phosphoribosyltransferase [Clostridiales bacterium PH28_bin88]|nr:hypoxanthine phosphoribosyltransferase [Clostridiales bacterium PH28_bin88]